MVHAVSASYLQFERMSPPAAGMALALHLAVALALYMISPLKFTETEGEPIEVTMEAPPPKPPEQQQAAPTPPPPSQAAPPPAAATPPPPAATPPRTTTQAPIGVRPPAASTADKPTPEPPKTQEPAKKEEPQQALAPAKPEPEPEPAAPPVEKILPPVEAPPPPLSMRDFVKIAPPPPPQEVVKPMPRQATPQQHQQLPSSPLSHLPQQRAPNSQTANAPSNTFVNPAQNYARTRMQDEYVWAIIRKFSQYLPNLREKNEGGTVVLRFTIARDGRLLDASIARSSGVMALDKGLLEAIRAAAPYPPLPPDIPGARATFTQEITAKQ